MKVTCLQENLARGLGIVGRAVAVRSTLPITSNVLIATDGGRIKLAATNLDIALQARELNPGIKVVLRMFDPDLARRVESGFGIHTAFSTSALAASSRMVCRPWSERRSTLIDSLERLQAK